MCEQASGRSWARRALRCALVLAGLASAGCSGDRLVLGGGGDSGCVPGSYAGSYACSPDASFGIGASGPLELVLQGDRGGAALYIAPGATLTGNQAGETLSAPVTGTLDCKTYRLNATIGDLDVGSASAPVATFNQVASMTASYDPDASPPALVMGTLTAFQGQPGLVGSCTWSAELR